MPTFPGARSRHHLLLLFLAAAFLPSAMLVWLGWQLVEQDRRLERQRVQDVLESTANSVSAGIERELGTLDRELASLLASQTRLLGDTATAARFDRSKVVSSAGAPLLYQPTAPPLRPEPPDSLWADAELLEFARKDLPGATRKYRALSNSSDPNVRAGALVRLARTFKKAGLVDQALETYAAMNILATASVNGNPADLMARWARLDLFDRIDQRDNLVAEASALRRDLDNGRWVIDRTSYLTYWQSVVRWTKAQPESISHRAALTEAVVSTWDGWRERVSSAQPRSERRSMNVGGTQILLLSREDGDSLLLFAATPDYLTRAWSLIWPDSDIAVALVDDGGAVVVGRALPPSDMPVVVKPASDTRLPWTLRVSAASTPAHIAATGALRRRIIFAGLALVAFLIPATGYLVGRVVQKELAVVKQQADFVSAVSHEFRSPLTSLTHITFLLRSEFQPTEARRRQYYDVLARETDRLRRFVETLLDFGRMQAGAMRYRPAPLDVVLFVTGVVDEFRNDAAAATHDISVSSCGSGLALSGDREALGRAIWNLLENAAKYSPDGSPIGVRIEADQHRATIQVIDQGVGIPEGEQAHVFRQFFRGEAASHSAVKGTGVGLAVVQHIVRGHGGDIRLESAPGSGSTFTIVLPANPRTEIEPPVKAS